MQLEGKSLKTDFLKFIIPSIIAQCVFSLYTMVDGIFVARGVSEVALTAVNISMPFSVGLFSISLLFAVGNSTIVAISLGKGEKERANQVFTQNIVVLCVLAVIVTALVLIFLEPFARFLGATDTILPYAKEYIGTIAPFAIAYMLSYSFETLIKTDGYPKLATIYVTSGAVLNCILDYLMVIRWNQGVRGAAWATGLSQAAVIVLYLKHFLGPKGTIRFAGFRFSFAVIWRQIQNGFASGITEFSGGMIIFFFNQAILAFIGEEAFKSCTSLGSITIPGGVSKIGDSAFNNCWMLSSVTLNDGIETIGDYSFSGCSMITTIKIPGTVASIGDDSFYNCRLLSEITIDTESTTPPGGVLPWGGYEYYDNGEKYKALTIKNANGYVFFQCNV